MQERASRTRVQILRAAAELFEAKGYAGARLDEIVARPKMSKGALYFHFSSKEALATAILDEYRELWPSLINGLRPEFPRAMPLLFALSGELAGRFRADAIVRAGIRLTIERSLISPSVRSLFQHWADEIGELLREARAQGDLAPDVDIEPVAGFLAAAFTGCQQVFAAMGDREEPRRCVRTMWASLLPGLVEPGRLPEMRRLLAEVTDADAEPEVMALYSTRS